ncbi:MAG: formylglycine-generating enzyme family protein [Candidatus Accumulibacter phosphatis]|nr:formylglycine-generating enzyme family protein [Candidatus Accumulibacter phosphatis]
MSWLQPTDFERELVAALRGPSPQLALLARLARLLAPATRIEPLLLRNARLHFLPGSANEIESFLWFSPLVGARSSSNIVFHSGVARLLAEELQNDGERFAEALEFIDRHTRHWLPEDRLEQTMRLDTLCFPAGRAHDRLHEGLRDMLRLIARERDEKRRTRLARSIRQTLATIGLNAGEPVAELRWLQQYTSRRLGTSATPPADSLRAQPLPAWLGEAASAPAPRFARARLAARVHYDAGEGSVVLRLADASETEQAIEFPTPLPADLHVQARGAPGRWHLLATSEEHVRVPIAGATPSLLIELTTIDGRRYHLTTTLPEPLSPLLPTRLLLSHLPEDRERARLIAKWLRQQGIGVERIEEAPGIAAESVEEHEAVPILRLWTTAARQRLPSGAENSAPGAARSALLRVDPAVELPQAGYGAGTVLDVRGWRDGQLSEEAGDFLRQLAAWLAGETPPAAEESAAAGEAERLLAELENPRTPPPRRLAIGDRLAEIGDPRRGVGVREFVVDEESAAEPPLSGEASALLAGLENPQTPPPRRLEIGDRLAGIGDPRRGVGLDARGLPEIDWVDVPGGEFVYQQGEKRTLPAFRIARYPITNVQYQTFVDAGDYREERWWRDLRRPKPEPSRWPQGNRPRTDVDWYEAVAFTRWLSAQLGYEVRLPTEEEWERAAGGPEGREYPWGAEYESGRANIDETWGEKKGPWYLGEKKGPWYLEQTTAVGVYPHGASPEGVLDLSGNVWEWCLNQYDQPERIQPDTSDQSRVLRGGSWDGYAAYARASRRGRHDPDNRDADVGFRLVSSAPII